MDLKLEGKRALVTGSSGGIGEGIARTLAAEGVRVVIHGRQADAVAAVAEAIRQAGGQAAIAIGDLADDAAAQGVAEAALAAFGGIDILVNNAGSYQQQGWMDTTPERWADLFNHNLLSMVRMIRAFAPAMREAGWGRLIQISSAAAVQPQAFGPDYSATKAGIVNMTVSLAKSLANTGVTAVTVSPGPVLTKGFEAVWRNEAKIRGWSEDWDEIEKAAVREVLPILTGRVGRIEEVAALVAFVASPLSGFINGANLRADGGYVTGV